MRFFLIFLYKGICCGYSFELHRQVDAIQMSTNNICLYKEVDKKYTCCNLKTMELLDCVLIGICTVIRSNTVFCMKKIACFSWHTYVSFVCIGTATDINSFPASGNFCCLLITFPNSLDPDQARHFIQTV